MPTPAERRALLFLSSVALLGAGVRVVRVPPPVRRAQPELERQVVAVESARVADSAERADKRRARRTRRAMPADTVSVDAARRVRVSRDSVHAPTFPIDLDVADSAAIERLPGIGPVLAGRIVADRSARGTFGSLEGLQQVRGVGPGLARRVAQHVTFSGRPRQHLAGPGASRPGRAPRAAGGVELY